VISQNKFINFAALRLREKNITALRFKASGGEAQRRKGFS